MATEALTLYAGADWQVWFTVTDEDGAAVNVAAATAKALIKNDKEDADSANVAQWTVDLTQGATGKVILNLPLATTDDIAPGVYYSGVLLKVGTFTGNCKEYAITVLRPTTRATA